ncbi:YdcF family protein [[Clostridium] fimetarium]|uniref:DUF218 domain-containing protein n=1 Tax=[Clostridium] fimetarium TaxID=99656 RepID=A0A1I0RXK8_9FIRM|nr:YdcF family protein [[Clostridium] fimetarium]SEW46329.1 DUF218 domain-containing protein [[Clostridium] fimetarium]
MNMRIIDDITNFIFIDDTLEQADVIMIPGGSYPELPEQAAKLWNDGYAPIVTPSGGVSIKTGKFNGVKAKRETYSKNYLTECEFYTDVLLINSVEASSIIGENQSGNTSDNARFSKQILESRNISPKSAIICCKNFHTRRCLMFYQFAFPNTKLIINSVPYSENGQDISRENWYKTDTGLNRVLGELHRLGNQFSSEFLLLKAGDL